MGADQSGQDMWREYLAVIQETPETTEKTYTAWHFDIEEKSAEELAALVLAGQKRATASSLWAMEADGDAVPTCGDFSVVTGWDGTAKCIIQTTQVEIVAFKDVQADFACREGEGDGSLEYWQRVHVPYFSQECVRIGRVFADDMPVICEDFRVVFPLSCADSFQMDDGCSK